MKNCRTVNGLIKALSNGENAQLKVYGVDDTDLPPNGKVLNMGCGKHSYISERNWNAIKNYVKRY
jgi:hypothetical protein